MTQYPTINPKATGNRIKELRKENHIKVCDIVEFMGFESQQSIYKWQRGDSLPSVDNLYALSRLFGTTVDSILVGYEEEEESSSSHFKVFFPCFVLSLDNRWYYPLVNVFFISSCDIINQMSS